MNDANSVIMADFDQTTVTDNDDDGDDVNNACFFGDSGGADGNIKKESCSVDHVDGSYDNCGSCDRSIYMSVTIVAIDLQL